LIIAPGKLTNKIRGSAPEWARANLLLLGENSLPGIMKEFNKQITHKSRAIHPVTEDDMHRRLELLVHAHHKLHKCDWPARSSSQ